MIQARVERLTLSVAHFLKPFLPFANNHNCEFLTEQLWHSTLPEHIQRQLDDIEEKQLIQLLTCDLQNDLQNQTQNERSTDLERHLAPPYCNECTKQCLKVSRDGDIMRPEWGRGLEPAWDQHDLYSFITAARRHTLPELGVMTSLDDVMSDLMTTRRGLSKEKHTTITASEETEAVVVRVRNAQEENAAAPRKSANVLEESAGGLAKSAGVRHGMGEKKCHEVHVMTEVCGQLAKMCQTNQVVDIGSGRGYLGAQLSLSHGLKVLGIDSSNSNTESANSRTARLTKLWPSLVQQAQGRAGAETHTRARTRRRRQRKLQQNEEHRDVMATQTVDDESTRDPVPTPPPPCHPISNLYVPITQFVTEQTDIAELIHAHFGEQTHGTHSGLSSVETCHKSDPSFRERIGTSRNESSDTGKSDSQSHESSFNTGRESGGSSWVDTSYGASCDNSLTSGYVSVRSEDNSNLEDKSAIKCNLNNHFIDNGIKIEDQTQDCSGHIEKLRIVGNTICEDSRKLEQSDGGPHESTCVYRDACQNQHVPFDTCQSAAVNTATCQVHNTCQSPHMVQDTCENPHVCTDTCQSPCAHKDLSENTHVHMDTCQDAHVLLTGLHTCGDLAASVLRVYTCSRHVRGVCAVGCCYHLMYEHFLTTPFDPTDPSMSPSFPLSSALYGRGCQLGRNARMLAGQSLDRTTAQNKAASQSLYWRALLQVILHDVTGESRDDWRIGRIAAKCECFAEYVNKALRKLGIDKQLSKEEITAYEDKYAIYEPRMAKFFHLKSALAPVIETLILLDRLLYVIQQDCTASAHLARLFEPVTSPRCYAIIAFKNT